MTNKLSFIVPMALTVMAMGSSTSAQAASRMMDSSLEGFQYRCENNGGAYARENVLVTCDTSAVLISCAYINARQANCDWPGNDRPIVFRVIGFLPGEGMHASSASSDGGGTSASSAGGSGGGGGGGGGFQGPKDIKAAPNNPPSPGFGGPKDIKMAP